MFAPPSVTVRTPSEIMVSPIYTPYLAFLLEADDAILTQELYESGHYGDDNDRDFDY